MMEGLTLSVLPPFLNPVTPPYPATLSLRGKEQVWPAFPSDPEFWNALLNLAPPSIRWCRWEKPQVGWTKLNTDASIGQEKAGFGGLLRDFKGDAVCAFLSKSVWTDVFAVELLAILRGLIIALSFGIEAIWVESDSLSVVKTINRQQSYRGKAYGCLESVWQILSQFKRYQVSHSFREGNRAADYLSKMALDKSDVVYRIDSILYPVNFPNGLSKIIIDDDLGRIYYRKKNS